MTELLGGLLASWLLGYLVGKLWRAFEAVTEDVIYLPHARGQREGLKQCELIWPRQSC